MRFAKVPRANVTSSFVAAYPGVAVSASVTITDVTCRTLCNIHKFYIV